MIFPFFRLLLSMKRAKERQKEKEKIEERKKATVYVREDCPHCKDALDYLTVRRVGFKTVDVSKNEEELEHLRKLTGQTKTPTMVFHDDVLRDFGLHELKSFLDKQHLD